MKREGRQLGNELVTVPSAPSMVVSVGHTNVIVAKRMVLGRSEGIFVVFLMKFSCQWR